MDGFSYVDIFATKGIEYLLVIIYLLILVPFIRALFSGTPRGDKGTEEKNS